MPKLLILSLGQDTAGVGYALKQAFDHYAPDWTARAVRGRGTYLDYPSDITWHKSDAETGEMVRQLAREADVIHILQWPRYLDALPQLTGQRVVVWHLGTIYREGHSKLSHICRLSGFTEAVMSHELQQFNPTAELLPLPINAEQMQALRVEQLLNWRNGPIVIAHAPTDRVIKDTQAFLDATARLSERYDIEVDLIEKVAWQECLARKAQADILYDQVQLGYGLNAVEAFAMGIPVVAGLESPKANQLLHADWGDAPYMESTASLLEMSLEHLIVDPDLRYEYGLRGMNHAFAYHDEPAIVKRAIEIYDKARPIRHRVNTRSTLGSPRRRRISPYDIDLVRDPGSRSH